MAATRRLTELISAALPKLQLPDGPVVVVALSGGADSAALAYLTVELGLQTRGLHVDHGLPASPMMAAAAEDVAKSIGISLDRVRVVVGDGPSPEEQARNARYAAFADVGGPMLTAHTRDDNVETMLINLIRGSGPAGLAGIPTFRPPHVHRPMLEITRNETREIATLAGLPFVDDPVNEDLSLTRNRVRLQLLPLMRELNPQFDSAVSHATGTVGRDARYLEDLAASHETGSLPVAVITTLPRVVADRILRRALVSHGIAPTANLMERIWSVASGGSDRQDLAGGRSIVRRGALLVIE